MDKPILLGRSIRIPPEEVLTEYSRSGGPGGQHVNKTETRVTLRFNLANTTAIPDAEKARMLERLATRVTKSGDILVSCDAHRDRQQNLRVAEERLVELLARAFAKPRLRQKTKPTRGSKERRLEEKRRTKGKKEGRKRPDE